MRRYTSLRAAIIGVLFLAACSPAPQATAPTALPEPTAAPTRTPPPPTSPPPTLVPTATTPPTATPLPSPTPVDIPPTPTLAPLAENDRTALFEQIWNLVNERYVYADFGGADWEAIRQEFAQRVAATSDEAEFYGLMAELIDRLGDEHSRYASPQEVSAENAQFDGNLTYGGIGARIRDDEAGGFVVDIAADSPAESAGIRFGDIITAINGTPFTDTTAFGPLGPLGQVRGPQGTSVTLTVRTSGQPDRELVVVRRAIPAGAFPPVSTARLNDGQVGYIAIDTFNENAVDEQVGEALEALAAEGPLDGLVIDVRANAGGRVSYMLNTVGFFLSGGSIGESKGRSESFKWSVPKGRTIAAYDNVPIVVLVSEGTVSAGEMFAGGMQARGRARVVGVPSAGNVEALTPYTFDDGSELLLAESVFLLPDGTLVEGRGVIPDQQVDADWWRYELSDDPQIRAALDLLAS